ncbi:Transcriptional regulator, TetR family [Pseudomonas syringae pv. tagetis]|uniref:Transcriptional regulator, TetR family n=1 Tax=Pseudomonas syringae pv. tagetis TaxID=129140 RepID=A0A0Q0B778_9PSED|nr:Transcriptional regulator, TetR family [Pseudomonas syringae pv. tagetis]RMW11947.1 Transcriptional regulator, TetR family [Pseudomonas syringae pv. tagetis]RMW24892.1 Transcriptional regulator, TetR family [Pseudomonas syringae pv. tagetis]
MDRLIAKDLDNAPARHGEAPGLPKPARGRKRDPARDAAILDAAIDVLAESGYDGMTMDMVASRAGAGKATVYRRWNSKAELIVDAVAHLKHSQVDLHSLPDTGSLRGDLLAMFKPQSAEEGERKMRVMAGLASVLLRSPQLAEAGHAAIVEPWAMVNRMLMQRALERGEISANADVDAACQVLPCMAAYRALVQRKPFDLQFLTAMIDGVLLPALSESKSARDEAEQ